MTHRKTNPDNQSDPSSQAAVDEKTRLISKKTEKSAGNNQKCFWLLFFIGTINNTGYVLVLSSAQSLARRLHKESFMALFAFVVIISGSLFKLFNSKYLLKIKHMNRIIVVGSLQCIAFITISISMQLESDYAFYLALAGSILIGGSCSLGEQIILGFLKGFPPKIVSGWSSGTGFAGVFGAGFNLFVRFYRVPDIMIFLGMTPAALIYILIFREFKNTIIKEQGDHSANNNLGDHERKQAINNQKLSFLHVKRLWGKILYFVLNLPIVYFMQYSCITGFADKATNSYSKSSDFLEKNGFIGLQLCYQIGVLISRSSLPFFHVKKVWIITIFQFTNFVLWAIIAQVGSVPLPIQFALMIWVGLNAGGSYVNVYYLLLDTQTIKKEDKEIALTLLSIMCDIGIMLASFLSLVLANTLYKK